eukprot:COSAG01_NODE_1263_length_10996_cov_70.459117_3_plen_658_part_00
MGFVLILINSFAGDYEENSITVFAWSYANLDNNNMGRLAPAIAAFWCIASIVLFSLHKQKTMDSMKHGEASDSDTHTSACTVWVQEISMAATEQLLDEYVEVQFAGQTSQSKLVLDLYALGHNVRAQKRAILKINSKTEQYETMNGGTSADKLLDEISALKSEVDRLAQEEPALRSKEVRCAGSAFITFKLPADAQKFRQKLANGTLTSSSQLSTDNWTAKMAPMPSEIYWENFGLDAEQKRNAMMKSSLLTIGMYITFVLISCGAVWCIGFDYMYYLYWMTPQSWAVDFLCPQKDAMGAFLWYGVFGLSFVLAFLILEEEMAPIIKYISKYESPMTKSIKQISYLGKCYWFYVIYHMVLSTVILGWLAANVVVDEHDDPRRPRTAVLLYVEAIGAFHQHRVFLTVGVIDMIHLFEGVKFFTRQGKSLTVEELDEFRSAEDEEDADAEKSTAMDDFYHDKFDFSRNYGETIGVFTSICYYQVMHPTILFCGCVYYATKYIIDKYQITKQYSKPRVQYGGRARTTTKYLFWSMAIGQVGNIVHYMLLVEDYFIGTTMILAFMVSSTVLGLYLFQPTALKLAKTAARAKRKGSELESDSSSGDPAFPEQDAENTRPEPVYSPPTADELVVGVEIVREVKAKKQQFPNPLSESDDGISDE